MSNTIDEALPSPDGIVVETFEPAFVVLYESGEDTDVSTEPLLKSLSPEQILDQLGRWYFRAQLELASVKASHEPLIERLEGDIEYLEKRLAFVKLCIQKCAPPGSFLDAYCSDVLRVLYTPSEKVVIDDPTKVEDEYVEMVRVVKPAEVKKALQAGKPVSGAHLEQHRNLQVKPGGVKAMANAAKLAKQKAKEK
jgi:hypothetical protein